MGHLPAAESQARLYLIPLAEETDGLILLSLVVVFVHGYGKLDFLHRDDSLLLACGALAFFLLVKITAVVLDAADGRNSSGRNFDEIEATLAGDSQRFIGRQNAQLLADLIDNTNFAGADALIDADKGLSRTFVECDGAPPEMVRACPGSLPQGRRGCANAQEYSIAGAPNEPDHRERSAGVLDGTKKGLGGGEPVGPNLGQAIGREMAIQLQRQEVFRERGGATQGGKRIGSVQSDRGELAT
jgi:hypothetical protein